MENLYQIEDLLPIVKGSEKLLLFVRTEDKENPEALALEVNLSRRTYSIDLLQRYLKFGNYEEINEDPLVIEWYRSKVDGALPDEVLVNMVVDFTSAIENWNQLENKYDFGNE